MIPYKTTALRGACLSLVLLLSACITTTPPIPAAQLEELKAKAENGDARAQFNLAMLYDSGRGGVSRSGAEAEKWYRRAAESGLAEAQNSLGSGAQAARRYEEARGWYEKAAAQNHDLALNSLGYLYDMGLGVPQDRRKAFEYYTRAANVGEPEAMWNIANMYGAGQVGDKDMHMACVWVFRANRFSSPGSRVEKPAQQGVVYLRRTLSADDLRRCITESGDWSPSAAG
ncbi:tetratricopeptide repeat protein [Ferrovibrio terrae]|uniref:tetratricopeptide repeat protein n=1 Tax=Ferrovibrio terrae TaxID=2594003 RepID=UPI0031381A0D